MTTPERRITVQRWWDDKNNDSTYLVVQGVNILEPQVDAFVDAEVLRALIDAGVEVTVNKAPVIMPTGGDNE